VGQLQPARPLRFDQRERCSTPPGLHIQFGFYATKNQLLDGTAAESGLGFELAIEWIGNIYGCPH
ncbi:MAG TPA: hypothetical protein VEF05_08645, partial [Terriglobales bacterium]|nr:hypothetical protein [Terriglobales bacterium]